MNDVSFNLNNCSTFDDTIVLVIQLVNGCKDLNPSYPFWAVEKEVIDGLGSK